MLTRLFTMRERGQVVMFTALLLPILLGMTAMSVDIGSYSSDRRQLQNAADSIALAAASQLPDAAKTQAAATAYATKNGISANTMTVTISGGTTAPQVRVVIDHPHTFAFVKVLGISQKNVSGTAAAAKVSLGGSNGIVPWAVTQATVDAAGNGTLVTMKYDETGSNLGNFGAIRIDGSGSATYRTDVEYGSTAYACAETAPHCTTGACPGSYPNVCAETAPGCDGPECTPETGNMIGPTKTAVDFRMNNTSAACDTFDETFGTADADGKYHLATACNPWLDGSTCPNTPTPCSRRVIIIPVVDSFGNGASDTSTIQRFALVYLEGYTGTCQGSSCDIQGRFVNADLTTRALAGLYDPGALVHFTKLVE